MRLNDILAGIEIIRKYYEDKNGYHLCAEHDELAMCSTDSPMCLLDIQQMLNLGWFQRDGANSGSGVQHYDKYEPWTCYP